MQMIQEWTSKRLPLQRDRFEIPDEITWLNCANLSPQLRTVSAAGLEAVALKKSPWEMTPPSWFSNAEILRGLAAKIMGATADDIALVPAVSYGMAVAAANIPVERGQSIVLLHEEYPSNYYAWKEVSRRCDAVIRLVRRGDDGKWTQTVLEGIDQTTAVVSVPNCHWTDGSLIDLEQVGKRTRAVGASLVIDASQSLGAYPIDVGRVQPDFLVSVGYKWLLGPYALGYLYVAPKWQARGKPLENSWLSRAGSEDFARLVEYRDECRSGARRFDMGEFPNFVLLPMAIAALRQILEWGVENIQQTLSNLTDLIASEADKLGCTSLSVADRVNHMIGLRLPKGIPVGLGEALADSKVFVSIRGDAIRIAPYLYNDEDDIEKFFSVVRWLI
jgi:selenocysteine lyase/cysteine desulfurase